MFQFQFIVDTVSKVEIKYQHIFPPVLVENNINKTQRRLVSNVGVPFSDVDFDFDSSVSFC